MYLGRMWYSFQYLLFLWNLHKCESNDIQQQQIPFFEIYNNFSHSIVLEYDDNAMGAYMVTNTSRLPFLR